MKCPYRTVTIHENHTTHLAKDIVEFAECYGNACPYYEVWPGKCKKIEKETERFNE